jgi:hypothetical protein
VVTPGVETHVNHQYELRSYDGGEWAGVLGAAGMEVVSVVDEDGADIAGVCDGGWREGWVGYGVFVLRREGGG